MPKNFLKISAKKILSQIFLKILIALHFLLEHAINLNYKTQNYKLPKQKNKLPKLRKVCKLSILSKVCKLRKLVSTSSLS